MKNRKKRNLLILVMIVLSFVTTVAYSVIQTSLEIKGGAVVDSNGVWNIYFDNLNTSTSGSAQSTNANIKDTSLIFDINLIKPLDSVTYIFDVVNDGKVDALLSSITLFNEDVAFTNNIIYELTYYDGTKLEAGTDVLEKHTSKKLKLVIKFNDVDSISSESVNLNLGASLIYVQKSENNVQDPVIVDKAYLKYKSNGTYDFKEEAYKTKIKNIYFVNHIDTSKAVKTYDLGEKENSIIGWINEIDEDSYELYIGSNYKIYAKNLYYYFSGMTGVERIYFNNFDTSEVTNMAYMFNGLSSLTSLDLSNFDTSNVTNMSGMFQNNKSIISLDVSNFDTSNVTSMSYMFNNVSSLTKLDVSSFNVANVTSMSYMFQNMSGLLNLNISNFYTPKLNAVEHMFKNMTNLVSLDISNLNTSNVKSMQAMFTGLRSLTSLDVSNLDTSQVTNMRSMFDGDSSLTNLDVSNFDTSNVTNMYAMFSGLSNISQLDVSNFDTSKVIVMAFMFQNMSSLTSLDVSNFDTSKVNSIGYMFSGTSSLKELDLTNFDTSKVVSFEFFLNGSGISGELDLTHFDTSNVVSIYGMFQGAKNITKLNLAGWDTSKIQTMRATFNDARSLTYIDMTGWTDSATSGENGLKFMFQNCFKLETVKTTEYVEEGTLDLSTFTNPGHVGLIYMFASCQSAKIIDISNLYAATGQEIYRMFNINNSLVKIYVGDNWLVEYDKDLTGITKTTWDKIQKKSI